MSPAQDHRAGPASASLKARARDLDEEDILTFPPEPLHINLLGPVNQVVEALEILHKEEMDVYYKQK